MHVQRRRAASAPFRSPTSTACPATRRELDTTLAPDELITAIELPPRTASPRTTPTSSCATARPTPSRWSRSPRRWRSTAARSARRASRSAASRTSPGASPRPRRCWRARRRRRRPSSAAADALLRGRAQAAGAATPSRSSWRAAPSSARCGRPRGTAQSRATAAMTEHRDVPAPSGIGASPVQLARRRPRQGHGRGALCRRASGRRTWPTAWSSSSTIARGQHRAHRRRRGAARVPGVLEVFTHENRPPMRALRPLLQGHDGARRARRSAAARRRDPSTAASRSRWWSPRRFEAARYAASLVRGRLRRASRTRPTCWPAWRRAPQAEPAQGRLLAAAQAARRRRGGLRRGAGAGRRASTTAASSTTTRWRCTPPRWSARRRRHAHRLRQDAGRAEQPLAMCRACFGLLEATRCTVL